MDDWWLETEHVRLRPLRESDADALFALDSDPEVMRYISAGNPTPMEVIRAAQLPKLMRRYGSDARLGAWAAIARDSDAFLGWIHLRPYKDDQRVLELGYRLARDAWGKGLATEGSIALVAKGFREFGADRIVAKTMMANRASRRVMEKAGLQLAAEFEEGRFPGDDKRAVFYEITREQFEQRDR